MEERAAVETNHSLNRWGGANNRGRAAAARAAAASDPPTLSGYAGEVAAAARGASEAEGGGEARANGCPPSDGAAAAAAAAAAADRARSNGWAAEAAQQVVSVLGEVSAPPPSRMGSMAPSSTGDAEDGACASTRVSRHDPDGEWPEGGGGAAAGSSSAAGRSSSNGAGGTSGGGSGGSSSGDVAWRVEPEDVEYFVNVTGVTRATALAHVHEGARAGLSIISMIGHFFETQDRHEHDRYNSMAMDELMQRASSNFSESKEGDGLTRVDPRITADERITAEDEAVSRVDAAAAAAEALAAVAAAEGGGSAAGLRAVPMPMDAFRSDDAPVSPVSPTRERTRGDRGTSDSEQEGDDADVADAADGAHAESLQEASLGERTASVFATYTGMDKASAVSHVEDFKSRGLTSLQAMIETFFESASEPVSRERSVDEGGEDVEGAEGAEGAAGPTRAFVSLGALGSAPPLPLSPVSEVGSTTSPRASLNGWPAIDGSDLRADVSDAPRALSPPEMRLAGQAQLSEESVLSPSGVALDVTEQIERTSRPISSAASAWSCSGRSSVGEGSTPGSLSECGGSGCAAAPSSSWPRAAQVSEGEMGAPPELRMVSAMPPPRGAEPGGVASSVNFDQLLGIDAPSGFVDGGPVVPLAAGRQRSMSDPKQRRSIFSKLTGSSKKS